MFSRLETKTVSGTADIKDHFDRCAPEYNEQHGDAERLLEYRLGLIRKHAQLDSNDVVLDVGCGPGHHLLALAGEINRGIGIDLSSGMIEVARRNLLASAWKDKLEFVVENGEGLESVAGSSVDLAICIGALEHIYHKESVLAAVHRVLKPQGRFFCLTPHGGFLWYRAIAPLLGMKTKHLSTDRFLTRKSFTRMLKDAGFSRVEAGHWKFIPKGDMPGVIGVVIDKLDVFGKLPGMYSFRSGLMVCARKSA
ncbi:MAG: methyltransferase domain-containing protein [Pyrinomonadaceae bacterium]|nr:methyltransferase domain-containing protein [Pyrinomonadaceae bacterium]